MIKEYEDRCDLPRTVAQEAIRVLEDLEADLYCMASTGEALDPNLYLNGVSDLVRELAASIAALQYVQAARFREANMLPPQPAARLLKIEGGAS